MNCYWDFLSIHTEMHRLIELRDRNDKMSGHLSRNRTRDFTLKQEQVEVTHQLFICVLHNCTTDL